MSEEKALASQSAKPKTIKEMLQGDQFKNAITAALPKHLSADRFIRIALTAMTRTPKLAQCDQSSFFQSLLTLSQCGIEPDGRRAYLIPFENRKRNCTECQLIISYMGLLELAMRSGTISNVHADKVCENDEFEYDRGQILKHKIDFRKPRGKAYAYYAVARFKDGTEKSEVMPSEDIEAIRKRSKAANAGPWITDYDEMAKKSAFRRLSKWLQLSPEFRDALENDADSLPSIESVRVEAAKPVFAIEEPNGATDDIDMGPADREEVSIPTDDTPPEETNEPLSNRQQLAQALADADVKEAAFIAVLAKAAPKAVGKARLVAELTEEVAGQALADIDGIIAEIK